MEHNDNLIPLVFHNRDDLATENGNEYIKYVVPYHPQAVIDRLQYPEENKLSISRGAWERTVEYRLDAPVDFSIGLDAAYDETSREVDLKITLGVENEVEGNYRINVVITEDHIKMKQKYYAKPYKEIEEYYHSHVVRDMVTGGFGQAIDAAKFIPDQPTEIPIKFTVSPDFVDRHCSVVVFVHRDDGEKFGPVMQADLFKINDLMPEEEKK